MFNNKRALLLDMNSTFMFGEDRFGADENFYAYYSGIGGQLSQEALNQVIRTTYEYLDCRYPDEAYREAFPSTDAAIRATANDSLSDDEIKKVVATFAFHERGHIPLEYSEALRQLSRRFTLAAVIDIWSPKNLWLDEFHRAGVIDLFSATSFSSDHGMVKPSPKPFERVIRQLGIAASEALVIGDSVRRDLGGAMNSGIDCVLVGGANSPKATACFSTLLAFCSALDSPH